MSLQMNALAPTDWAIHLEIPVVSEPEIGQLTIAFLRRTGEAKAVRGSLGSGNACDRD